MEIINITQLTKEINTTFQKEHFQYKVKPFLIIVASFALLFALLSVVVGDWQFGLYILFFLLIFALVFFIVYKIQLNNINKSYHLLQEVPENSYKLTENEIQINSKSQSSSSSANYSYKLINSVLITKDIILLYINKVNAYIIDNNGFLSGTREDLIGLLKQNIEPKKIKGKTLL